MNGSSSFARLRLRRAFATVAGTFLTVGLICAATIEARAVGTTPQADETPCPMATPSTFHLSYPDRVPISPESAENFEHYNQDGHGSMLVTTRWDGSVKALVPPTLDIDAQLNDVLRQFARKISVTPSIECGVTTSILLVQFAVPSGKITVVQMHAPGDTDK
jgi:hypothetical protein